MARKIAPAIIPGKIIFFTREERLLFYIIAVFLIMNMCSFLIMRAKNAKITLLRNQMVNLDTFGY